MRFFKPAWMNKKVPKALKAVEKIRRQETLAQIAQSSADWYVRFEAAKKLTDAALRQRVYVQLTERGHLVSDLVYVVGLITDPNLIDKIVYSDRCDRVRCAAAARLGDESLRQAAFREIAINAKWCGEVQLALDGLSDQKLLEEVAFNAHSEQIRRAAADKLSDGETRKKAYDEADRLLRNNPRPEKSGADFDLHDTDYYDGDAGSPSWTSRF